MAIPEFNFNFENFDAAWIAYGITIFVIIWQIYEFFSPSKVKPNAQPEIYKRLEEIKNMRKQRNALGIFNHKDLTKYDGVSNPQLYIGLKTEIFDVSNAKDFQEGGEFSGLVAQEASVNFAKLSGDPAFFFKYTETNLTPEEEQQLEATYSAFKSNYKVVGTLFKELPSGDNDRKNI